MEDTATVIGRLLERLLDGVVVPFLGAGVSVNASSRTADATAPGTYVPTVKAMVKRLAWSLLEDIKATGQDAEALRALLFPSSPTLPPAFPPRELSLTEIIESTADDQALIEYLASLSGYKLERWTEALVAKRGWAATVDVLRIDRLAVLRELARHREERVPDLRVVAPEPAEQQCAAP